jgi:hypothetical protein
MTDHTLLTLARLEIRPGDTIVITAPGYYTDQDVADLERDFQNGVRAVLGNVCVIVVRRPIELAVRRGDVAPVRQSTALRRAPAAGSA